MQSGRLRHRIDLLAPAGSLSGTGGTTPGTPVVAADDIAASVEPYDRSAAEQFGAGGVTNELTHLVKIRYRDGVSTSMQVVFRGRTLEVRQVQNRQERNRELWLFCIERVS